LPSCVNTPLGLNDVTLTLKGRLKILVFLD
jgi:hypothetical protein